MLRNLKFSIQIFLKFFEKNWWSEKIFRKLEKKSQRGRILIKKRTIFCVLKSKKGPFFAFWKTRRNIAHFLICNFVQNPPIPQGFLVIICIITQHVHKHQLELIPHRIWTTFFCPKYRQCWISWETTHIFLFLGPGIHWLYFLIFGGIHENAGRKNWNFGGIHEMQKKKMKPPGA